MLCKVEAAGSLLPLGWVVTQDWPWLGMQPLLPAHGGSGTWGL